MAESLFGGYHATVFAYGQTGTGKTYTMEGYKYQQDDKGVLQPITADNITEQSGIVQRCTSDLIQMLESVRMENDRKVTLRISFLQLYNEKIFDLFNESMLKNKNLVINSVGGQPK